MRNMIKIIDTNITFDYRDVAKMVKVFNEYHDDKVLFLEQIDKLKNYGLNFLVLNDCIKLVDGCAEDEYIDFWDYYFNSLDIMDSITKEQYVRIAQNNEIIKYTIKNKKVTKYIEPKARKTVKSNTVQLL